MGAMLKYNANELAAMTEEEVFSLPPMQKIQISFEDGDIITSTERTKVSWFYWGLHRWAPKTPLLKSHTIGLGPFSNQVHMGLFEKIYKEYYWTYNSDSQRHNSKEEAWEVMYGIHNHIYNSMIQYTDRAVMSLSFMDFVEIMENPEVKAANESVRPDQRSIDETYDRVSHAMEHDPKLKNNVLSRFVRSRLVDTKQVHQTVSVRGFVTEIDSTIFPIPITSSFAGGMNRLYESMVESRSASKALMFAKDPLALCEYFNRKLQLICESLDTLALGDCGSNVTYDWKVEANELKSLEGINYHEGGEIRAVQATDRHLIGKTIKLRLPYSCQHPDHQTVCETCYGQTAFSIPFGVNPGHVSALTLGEIISQLVLSTKHVDGSSKVDEVTIDEGCIEYLAPGAKENTIRFAPEMKNRKFKLAIAASASNNIANLHKFHKDDLKYIKNISEMESVRLIEVDEQGEEIGSIVTPTSMGARHGSLSESMLMYIRHHGFELNDKGEYLIDITRWLETNASTEAFVLPLKHVNMVDFMNETQTFILTSGKKMGLKKYDSQRITDPVPALKALHTHVSSRISINMSHLAAITYCMSIRDGRAGDYSFPRGGEAFNFSTIDKIMKNRSLGVAMAYQSQEKLFTSPRSYTYRNRMRHPMDDILLR